VPIAKNKSCKYVTYWRATQGISIASLPSVASLPSIASLPSVASLRRRRYFLFILSFFPFFPFSFIFSLFSI